MSLSLSVMTSPEYRQLLQQCVHCGLCLEACPTYAVFGTEMDAPRGRIVLMNAAAKGELTPEEFRTAYAEHILLCLECRACETACPSGVQYGALIEGARIDLEHNRPIGAAERFMTWLGLYQLMPHLGRLKTMARLMAIYEKTGLQKLVRGLDFLPQPLKGMEAILPEIATDYLKLGQPAPALGEYRGKVAFFVGCIQEAFLTRMNAATVRILQRNGYEVHFPTGQTCCGAAQLHTGHEELALQLARANIDAFLSGEYVAIINNAGGCGAHIKEYPHMLRHDPVYAEKARQFVAQVQDVSEFILTHLHVPPQGALPVRVTYADSCHLRHGQKVITQPRALLQSIPGVELVELQQPDRCCGSAGIYNIVQVETANAILDAKLADIAATGAEVLVVTNTGCAMQLISGVRRARLPIKVMHLAEVLDLSYRVAEQGDHGLQTPDHGLGRRETSGASLVPRKIGKELPPRVRPPQEPALRELGRQLGPGRVITDRVELLTYERDAALDKGWPDAVILPYTTAEVQRLVQWAREQRKPLIARGAGTGLSGGAVAEHGGLILEFSHMKRVVELDRAGRSVVVEPGVINLALDALVKTQGLYYPADPASGKTATMGGNIAENAGGPHCFKYGVTTNYITGLEVVLADGQVLRLGGRALDYPEYDFVGLFNGSEGTLGIITEASARLVGNPPAIKTLRAAFQTIEAAGEAVSAIIACGLIPATLELMDQKIMQIVEDYLHLGLPVQAGALMIVEVDGYPESLDAQMDEVLVVLHSHHAFDLQIARTAAERDALWYGRKSALGALARLAPSFYLVDGTVPRSRLAAAIAGVNQLCEQLGLKVAYVMHAGDGNLHPFVLIERPDDPEFMARIAEAGRQILKLCAELGGTITGEHGVGIEKRDFMPLVYNGAELAAMRDLKQLFDPAGLLNPGKIFPPQLPPVTKVHGEPPTGAVFTPRSAEEAAGGLAALTAAGRPVHIGHNGAPNGAVQLSTAALRDIITYTLDDLYVQVGAGLPLAELQARLARDGMQVALAAPWPETTVGGLVAANLNGPLRMRYGGVRDQLLCATVALADGRVLRAGRPLVKNVAGYDLPKLFVGSYGTLGVLTDVTFRITPLPRLRRTLLVPVSTLAEGLRRAGELLPRALVASALVLVKGAAVPELGASPYTLAYTAEGFPQDVERELALIGQALQQAGAPQPLEVEMPTGTALWARFLGGAPADELLVRVGLPVKALPEYALAQERVWADRPVLLDVAAGQLYAHAPADGNAAAWLAALREPALAAGGYAVVLAAPETCAVERWGYQPASLPLMRGLKAQWDPAGILNRGALGM